MKKYISIFLCIVLMFACLPLAAHAKGVKLSPQNLTVNGKPVECEKYNIDGSNFFKLRDIAYLLNGTPNQFEVGYDTQTRTITVISGLPYTSNGEELVIGMDRSTTAKLSTQPLIINGVLNSDLSAYNLAGNNFYKLRDLGDALGFFVDYDKASNTAIIMSTDYVPTPTPEPLHEPTPTLPSVTIDFHAMLHSAAEAHLDEQTVPGAFDGFSDYLVEDPSSENLLTPEEVTQLVSGMGRSKAGKKVSYTEAAADVDLYFRALKDGYGAYYYFGGDEVFDAAKRAVLMQLQKRDAVDFRELGALLRENLQFMIDGHSGIEGVSVAEEATHKYQFYYCGMSFAGDENGYYCVMSGEKWYYAGCTANAAEMVPYLGSDGAIVYSPVVWCPAPQLIAADTMTLRCETKAQSVAIKWTQARPYSQKPMHEEICDVLEEQGILYVSMRNFQSENQKVVQRFLNSAALARQAKVLIFDLRSNGGGTGSCMVPWMNGFQGTENIIYRHSLAFSDRFSLLFQNRDHSVEKYKETLWDASFLPNDVPIIALVDNNNGSNGEDFVSLLKTLDNVLVVGANTGGYQLCGNMAQFCLPNTGMLFGFGRCLQFNYRLENMDGMGYAPDVWCDPANALDCVLAMLERYDLASGSTVETLRQRLDTELEKNVNLQLKWGPFTINPEDGFGAGVGTHYIDVLLDGVVITDYEVTSGNESICTVRKDVQGRIVLDAIGTGDSILTVTARGGSKTFRWHCG